MARQYGTILGLSWAGTSAAAAMALLSGIAPGQQPSVETPPRLPQPSNLGGGVIQHTMDGWDDQLLQILDFICVILGCDSQPQGILAASDLEIRVQAFIARSANASIPSDTSTDELNTLLTAVEDARWINGTQPLVSESLSENLDGVLARIEADIHAAIEDLNGAMR